MRRPRRIHALPSVAAAIAVALSGCDFEPPVSKPPAKPSVTVQAPDEAAPAPSPAPVPAASGGGARTPAEAASRYTSAFANWTWRDVATKNGPVLAALAAGKLQQAVKANNQELLEDAALQRDRAANRGDQLAIDVQGSEPDRRTVWIVMRETASVQGYSSDSDKRTRVYSVIVNRLDDERWYVVGFEQEG